MKDSLYLDEIFCSIQGESSDAGLPCTFIRLYGCNVGCSFCDQPQRKEQRKRASIDKIIMACIKLRVRNICLTGGEPLMQWGNAYPLVLELIEREFKVAIETSGCYPIDYDPYNRKFKYVMDVKCPSSGVSHKNVYENLGNLHVIDEVKFVITDEEDYEFMKKVLNDYPTKAHILVSPCFDENLKPKIGKKLADWIVRDRLNVRMQVQMHKILDVK